MSERGSIIPNGVVLKEHEMATVVLLTELGCNVELIPKSNLQGVRTPDVRIEGLLWEIKVSQRRRQVAYEEYRSESL